jgi:hypothetical protein
MGTGWLVFLFLELRNHTYHTVLNTRELESLRFDVCMPLHGLRAATCIGYFGRYAISLLLRPPRHVTNQENRVLLSR